MIRKYANKAVAWLINTFNVNMQGARALTVPGRKTGNIQTLVVNPLNQEGELYLVSSRGESSWVKNARAAGEVTLSKGNKPERYSVSEINDTDLKFDVMRDYLKRWGWQVSSFMHVSKSSTDEQVRAVLHKHPTFRLTPVG